MGRVDVDEQAKDGYRKDGECEEDGKTRWSIPLLTLRTYLPEERTYVQGGRHDTTAGFLTNIRCHPKER